MNTQLRRELIEEKQECPACTGRGELPVPKTYMTCPCCRGREKIRACKKCHGKGFL